MERATPAPHTIVIARLDRATQYSRAPTIHRMRSGILGPPLSRRVTADFGAGAVPTNYSGPAGTVALALAQRALHHHGVEPAAEFEADRGMGADQCEAQAAVQADRAGIGGIADHRDHLAVAAGLAVRDQPPQQQSADPAPMHGGRQIHRVLDGKSIGRARAIGAGIGVADQLAVELGREIGEAAARSARSNRLRHLLERRRRQLEGGGAVQHGLAVDRGDGGEVGRGGGPDRMSDMRAWESWRIGRHTRA